jgi:hypothetical protein
MNKRDEEFIYIPDSEYSLKVFQKMECMKKLFEDIKKFNPMFYKSILMNLPELYLNCLFEKKVYRPHLESFTTKNATKLKFMKDIRTTEEFLYNYYLGVAVEVLAQKLILALGFCCDRAGSDEDLTDLNATASTDADLHMEVWGADIEVKSTKFMSKYKALAIKSYQLNKYIKNNYNIFVIDYESFPGKVYYSWFPITDALDNISNPVMLNHKECKYISLKGQIIHCLDFGEPCSCDSCYLFNTFNKLNPLEQIYTYDFKKACHY